MDTFQHLKKVIVASLDIPETLITPESTLDDLFWEKRGTPPDSMDIVELMMHVEDEIGFEVPENDLRNLAPYFFDGTTTVQQMLDLINKQAKG